MNVLVDAHHNARLADFGLASALDRATRAVTNLGGEGTLRWMAPELVHAAQPRTDRSDVHALSITIWEVRSRSREI
jgi:serine/threonine protein kinase